MIPGLKDVYDQVGRLTQTDIERIVGEDKVTCRQTIASKALFPLLASLIEETGELARAVKIEDSTIKTPAGKKLDESSANECVDVAICGIMMYSALGGQVKDVSFTGSIDQDTLDAEYVEASKGWSVFEEIFGLNVQVSQLGMEINRILDGYDASQARKEDVLALDDAMKQMLPKEEQRETEGGNPSTTLAARAEQYVNYLRQIDTSYTERQTSTNRAEQAALEVFNYAYDLYIMRGGKRSEFSKIALGKLEKWSKNTGVSIKTTRDKSKE
jgi:NTP pyrophosphatase (non-canonical NTP hydrolase)